VTLASGPGSKAEETAEEVIRLLGLIPHPEGGHYRESYRPEVPHGGRGPSTAIYYLLREGELSAWHRVDADEVWHHYAGSSLELRTSEGGARCAAHRLGVDLRAGERPQIVVPAGVWQAARSLGPWTLVGCTVSPAFQFSGFELAPPGWEPGGSSPFSIRSGHEEQ
jgi:predicted cupin superfamily sugar epimerase